MKKKVKRVRRPGSDWRPFPQRDWQAWFAEFVFSQLAVEFYGRYKKWPKKIKLDSLKVVEQKDGGATLTVDLA